MKAEKSMPLPQFLKEKRHSPPNASPEKTTKTTRLVPSSKTMKSLLPNSAASAKTSSIEKSQLKVYSDDLSTFQTVSAFLRGRCIPGPFEKEHAEVQSAKLGTLLGVYLPTVQNILGVTMFLRLTWIIGVGGISHAFSMVFLCCLCTFLTSISLSAVATNGVIESGGTYYIISRNLGPEVGASIGLLFYLANTVATSMYAVGGVEILLIYMAPDIPRFGTAGEHNPDDMVNNFRAYGTVLLLIVMVMVAAGVQFVQLTAPISLACVIVSIISLYIGAALASPEQSRKFCFLGDRLLLPKVYMQNDTNLCNGTYSAADLQSLICQSHHNKEKCHASLLTANMSYKPGLPGLSFQRLKDNFLPRYLTLNESDTGIEGDPHIEVVQDMDTNFFIILAVFFPSVTGIFTGCNMSGDLKDPQKSLPIGTISAQLTTSFIYLSYVFLFGGAIERAVLRDKYGNGLNDDMITAQLAWPTHWIVLIGAFTSTFGAALQSLCSAPRLLQSIARDDVVPFLRIFSHVNRFNEPWNALWLTSVIAELGILIGSIEGIAPVVDFFFLMCYFTVNCVCVLQTWLQSPNWRPRFRYYHWTLSLLGAILCLFIMFSTYWYYALLVVLLFFAIIRYVQYKGAKKDWGDGIRGVALSTALMCLHGIEDKIHHHPKNWRPHLLVFVKEPTDVDEIESAKLIVFAKQLKGRGGHNLNTVVTLIRGAFDQKTRARQLSVESKLKKLVADCEFDAFVKTIIVTQNSADAIFTYLQTNGIDGLRANTVILGWPTAWKSVNNRLDDPFYFGVISKLIKTFSWLNSPREGRPMLFLDIMRLVVPAEMCLILVKNVDILPGLQENLDGFIDVWWLLQEGGLIVLIPFLMKNTRLWRACTLRIFAVAHASASVSKLQTRLESWLYHLRIEAEVKVLPVPHGAVQAYEAEKQHRIEDRINLLKLMTEKELRFETELLDDKTAQLLAEEMKKSPKSKSDPTLEHAPPDKRTSSPSSFDEKIYKKTYSALTLNRLIKQHSLRSQLTFLNLPRPPEDRTLMVNFLLYVETLTTDLQRVILVRGSGHEVITIA